MFNSAPARLDQKILSIAMEEQLHNSHEFASISSQSCSTETQLHLQIVNLQKNAQRIQES